MNLKLSLSTIIFLLVAVFSAQAQVLFEDFETWEPTGWQVYPKTGTGSWQQTSTSQDGNNSPDTAISGKYMAYWDAKDYPFTEGALISPLFNLSEVEHPVLTFKWMNNHAFTTKAPVLNVYVSYDGTTYSLLSSFETKLCNGKWQEYKEYLANNVVRIKIVAVKSQYTNTSTYIDAVAINKGPEAVAPHNHNYSIVKQGVASLSWEPYYNESLWNVKVSSKSINPSSDDSDILDSLGVKNHENFLVSGLTMGTTYYWYTQTQTSTTVSEWSTENTMFMGQVQTRVPFEFDFTSGSDGFSFYNGNEHNKWEHGRAPYNGSDACLYVSNDGGTTYSYDKTIQSRVHMYRDIVFDDTTGLLYKLSFDWKAMGDQYNDVMKVYLTSDMNLYPVPGQWFDYHYQIGKYYNLSNTWQHAEIEIPATWKGKRARLIISWMNNQDALGANPPAAIDNIKLDVLDCPAVTEVQALSVGYDTVQLSWIENGTADTWNIEYGPYGFAPGKGKQITATEMPFTIDGLSEASVYDVYVYSSCGNLTSIGSEKLTVTTLCLPDELGYSNDFESTPDFMFPTCWNKLNQSGGSTYLLNHQYYATSGTKSVAIINTSQNSGFNALISPELEGLSQHNKRVTFSAYIFPAVSLRVGVMSDITDPNTFIELKLLSGGKTIDPQTYEPLKLRYAVNLDDSRITEDYKYVAFRHGEEYYQKVVTIDDFVYDTIPDCPHIDALSVTSVEDITASISWEQGGSEDQWFILYGKKGFNPDYSGTPMYVSKTYADLTELLPGTTYEVYVSSFCEEVYAWSDVSVIEFTTLDCMSPKDLVASSIKQNSVLLNWTAGTSTAWNMKYGESGFNPDTATITNIKSNSFQINGLKENTKYDVYLRGFCANAKLSDWSMVQFTTLPVGVNDDLNDSFFVYPNPANDQVLIRFNGFASFSLTNILGNVVWQSSEVESQINLDVKSFARGVYFIRVNAQGKQAVQKLILR